MIEPELAVTLGSVGSILTGAIAAQWQRNKALEDRIRQDSQGSQRIILDVTEALRQSNHQAERMQDAIHNLTEALREANRKAS